MPWQSTWSNESVWIIHPTPAGLLLDLLHEIVEGKDHQWEQHRSWGTHCRQGVPPIDSAHLSLDAWAFMIRSGSAKGIDRYTHRCMCPHMPKCLVLKMENKLDVTSSDTHPVQKISCCVHSFFSHASKFICVYMPIKFWKCGIVGAKSIQSACMGWKEWPFSKTMLASLFEMWLAWKDGRPCLWKRFDGTCVCVCVRVCRLPLASILLKRTA